MLVSLSLCSFAALPVTLAICSLTTFADAQTKKDVENTVIKLHLEIARKDVKYGTLNHAQKNDWLKGEYGPIDMRIAIRADSPKKRV
jgi:hypothetical protein